MKKLLSTLLLFASIYAFGQTVPQGINYQAVAIDESGKPIPGVDIVGSPIDDAEIGIRISILENSPTGAVLYQEEHEVLTDLYGMFNLVIGQGLQVSPDPFSSIDWIGDKYLQVELSIDNNGDFKLSAVQQLMSVPYAFLAENAKVAQTVIDVDDADSDPTNELQGLSISNDTIYLSNGGFVTLPTDQINDADDDPNNELQVLSLIGDTIFLSNGGFIVLPTDNVNDADNDPNNEIQGLSLSNDTLYLSNGGFVVLPTDQVNDADDDPTNELQGLSISNDTIYLSNGGFVTLPTDQVNDADDDPTNELQVISIANDSIELSNGGKISIYDVGADYTIRSGTTGGGTGWIVSLERNGVIQPDFFRVSAGAGIALSGNNSTDYAITNLSNDMDSTNEIQTLSISNDIIYLSNNGGSVTVFDGDYNNLSNTPTIPTNTSDLNNDSGFLTSEVDGSTTNEIQTISKTGNSISLSNNGGSVTVFDGDYNNLTNTPTIPINTSDLNNDSGFLTSEVDGSTTNEIQILSISNDTIFLSGGGFVKLPATQSFDGDYNSLTNTPLMPSNTSDLNNDSGFLTSEVDGSTTNEIQTISKSGSTIALSNNGGTVTVFDGDYNNLSNTPTIPTNTSELNNDSGFLTSEVDGSTTNEIQILSISNDTIFLSGGGFVKLPVTQSFDGDYNNLSNTPTIPTNTSDLNNDSGFLTAELDGSTTNEIQTISKTGNSIVLSNNGGSVTVFDGDYNNLTNTPTIPTNTSDLNNDSGFLTSEVDGSTTNEIQTISKTGNSIALSNNGGSVTVFDGDYNNLSNTPTIPINTSDLNNDSGFLTSEMDGSTTNEIQDLSDVLSENNNAGSKAILNVQRQSIGALTPDTSAILDVASTNQGFLPPRMTEVQRDAIYSPATGLIIWCIDCDPNGGLQVFNGTNWNSLQEKSSGNTSTVSHGLTEYITSTTWIVPNGVTSIYIKMVGGGGGGGSSYGSSGCGWGGDGGGGGGLIYGRLPVSPNDTLNLIVGAGGTGGSNYSSGSSGGDTKVVNSAGNILAIAYGGGGGGGGNNNSNSPGSGGSGAFNVGQGLIKPGSGGASGTYKNSGGQGGTGGSVHSLFVEYPNRGSGGSGTSCPGSSSASSGTGGYLYIEW